ncbi:MAG: twin-arginine translocation signal domain-containing protein, partial [Rhodospirillaceae bacterium]
MRRRQFLRAAALAGAAGALGGCRFSLEHGLFNRCAPPGGHPVMREPLVRAAWDGIDASQAWDCHVHLFGNGRTRTGIYLNPEFDRPSTLAGRVRRAMFFNAACGGDDEERFDEAVV